jgi:putative cell wall-binding protein
MEAIKIIEREVSPLPAKANAIVINDSKTLEFAEGVLITIKQMRKKLEDVFSPIIKKAHEAHKEALNQMKKFSDPIDLAERVIKRKRADYLDELERVAREAAEKAKKQEEIAKEIGVEFVPEPVVQPIIQKTEGISDKKVWKFRIKDEKLIPREFLMVDERKISGVVKSMGKDAERLVTGIECYQERETSVRKSGGAF